MIYYFYDYILVFNKIFFMVNMLNRNLHIFVNFLTFYDFYDLIQYILETHHHYFINISLSFKSTFKYKGNIFYLLLRLLII